MILEVIAIFGAGAAFGILIAALMTAAPDPEEDEDERGHSGLLEEDNP